ncbi:MAG: hypothetical protein H6939_09140 [Burkholderiales bacterium]|nr:hypothetical protein [Burkholderiales bacterium]
MELLVVVAIIGILATIAGPIYNDYIDRVRTVQAVRDISAISKALQFMPPVMETGIRIRWRKSTWTGCGILGVTLINI